MMVFRILCTALGAFGLFLFIAPIFRSVFNIGTIAGILFSLLFLSLGLFEKKIGALIVRMCQSRGTTILFMVLVILAAILLGLLAFTGTRIVLASHDAPPDDATVIVLGCQVKGKNPSRMLGERISAAAKYLDEHPAAICIASGGKGNGEQISEARCIRDGLVARGISKDRILLEEKSTTTRENLLYSARILERKNLPTDLAIVTNEFHECRAEAIAEKMGFEAGAVPAGTYWLLLPTFFVREQFALAAEILFH